MTAGLSELVAVTLVALLFGTTAALAQTASPPADPPATDAKPDNPGLINELGKLFIKPADLFPSFKRAPDTSAPVASPTPPGDTAILPPQATPPAVTPTPAPAPTPSAPPAAAVPPPASARIPQMVTGRSNCPFAANGAPDCKIGADQLCKTKGYTSGSSLDTDAMQNCSKDALLAGARSFKDICRTETFVTRAMCQ